MAKKKATGGKGGPAKPLDRAARVALGEELRSQTRLRLLTVKGKNSGFGPQSGGVARSTEAKHEQQIILDYSTDTGIEPDEIESSVNLAKLIEKIGDDGEEAVRSGRLMLLKSELAKLVKLKSADIEEWLQSRLRDQV